MSAFKAGRLRAAANTSLGGDENEPILNMAERHDWALFRSIEGLQQKAGVPAAELVHCRHGPEPMLSRPRGPCQRTTS